MKPTAFMFYVALALLLEAVPASADSYTFTQLMYGSDSAYPNSINDNGQIVGWYLHGGVGFTHGFLDNHGVYTTIDPPNVPVHADAKLTGINNAGLIVGNVQAFGDAGMPIYEYGFLYSGGAFTTIGTPGSVSVNILGINNLNEILGEGGPCGCTFIYQGGVFTPVVGLPGRASGFNDSGQIVGFYDDAQGYSHGYLYADGSYTTVDAQGPPVPNGTRLWGINNADQIVGTADGLQPINLLNGFLYSGGKTTPILSLDGLQFLPTGLNNLGQIVGRVETGVLVSPALLTPEPASTAITMMGLTLLAGFTLKSAKCVPQRRKPIHPL